MTNEERRNRRLQARKERLAGKKCRNCEILLSERLIDSKRSYVFCRKCLEAYPDEARRLRWRLYYAKHKERLQSVMRERARERRKGVVELVCQVC